MDHTLNQFRVFSPQGSLISELIAIDHGQYIVRVSVEIDGVTRATGLAAAQTVELAEDQARLRAIKVVAVAHESATDAETSPPNPSQLSIAAELTVPSSPESNSHSAVAVSSKHLDSTPEVEDTPSPNAMEKHPISAQPTPTPEPTVTLNETVEPPSLTEEGSASQAPLFKEETLKEETPTRVEVVPPSFEPESTLSPSPAPEPEDTEPDIPSQFKSETPIDFSDIIARTNVELKRLGWTNQQGRDYLIETYGKRSRQLLTDEELLDFLYHLELEPTPE